MYTRASASDYDTWENDYGNSGWGFKDLIPLFNKVGLTLMSSDSSPKPLSRSWRHIKPGPALRITALRGRFHL